MLLAVVQRITSPRFIGRAAELARLAELRAQSLRTGQGVTVLVAGEPGVGKTRLCAEVAARSAKEGWTVLRGSCDEFGGEARPFAALQEMAPAIETLLRDRVPDELGSPAWKSIERVTSADVGAGSGGSVVLLCGDLFQRMAAVQPLVVIVDDLHWADESSRMLFAALSRRLRLAPAIVLGCYRNEEVQRGHPLRPVLAAIHRDARPEQMDLSPFGLEEAKEAVAAIAGTVGQDAFEGLFERSGGNAFLLEELLASPAGQLPRGVEEAVLARVDAMGSSARALAEAASLDTLVTPEVLGAVALVGEAQRAAAVDELVSSSVLVLRGDGYAFRHPLLREVLYAHQGAGRRPMMHRRMAEALELHEPGRVGEIARHWFEAGDDAKALLATLKAADRARAQCAMPEAASQFERALLLWDRVEDGEALCGRSRPELMFTLAEICSYVNWNQRAVDLARAALVGPWSRSRSIECMLWTLLGLWSMLVPELTDPLAFSRQAVSLLDEEVDDDTRIKVLSFFVNMASKQGLSDEAFAAAEQIRRIGASAGGPAAAFAAAAEAFQGLGLGDVSRLRTLKESFGRATVAGEDEYAKHLECEILCEVRGPLALHEENIEDGRKLSEWAVRHGLIILAFQAESFIAESFTRLGKFTEVVARTAALREQFGDEFFDSAPDVLLWTLGPAMVRMGQAAVVESWLPRGLPVVLAVREWFLTGAITTVRVELARMRGDRQAARTAIADAAHMTAGHWIAHCGEAVAYAIALEADDAFAAATEGTLDIVDGWVEWLRGCLLEAPGRARIGDAGMFLEQCAVERARLTGFDEATPWEELAARWEAMPRPFDAAYCRFRAGSALLAGKGGAVRRDVRDRAAANLRRALSATQEIGAVVLEQEIKRFMRSARVRETERGTPAVAPVAAEKDLLTGREMDVLALLVAGESNGRIALKLGITRNTASVHVSHILGKLGAANRVDAAVRAGRLGLVPPRDG